MAVFTFHLAELPSRTTARALLRPPVPGTTEGLRHAECLAMMTLGSPTFSTERMQLGRLAVFAVWDNEDAIDRFLDTDRLGRAGSPMAGMCGWSSSGSTATSPVFLTFRPRPAAGIPRSRWSR